MLAASLVKPFSHCSLCISSLSLAPMMGGGIPATQQQVQGDLPSWLPTCNTCKQKARTPDRFHPHGAILLWPKKGLCKDSTLWACLSLNSTHDVTV